MSKTWCIPLIVAVTLMSAPACAPINTTPAVYSPQLQPGKSLSELQQEVETAFRANPFFPQIKDRRVERIYKNIKSIHFGDDELSVELEEVNGDHTKWLRLFYSDLPLRTDACRPRGIDFPGTGINNWVGYREPIGYTVCDALYNIGVRYKEQQEKEYAAFLEQAARYNSLQVKPPISEEQRKFIVQANAFNERKEYAKAISLYRKAIEVDPVAYPEAYFNLALLSAQMQRFQPAIRYMKQYLQLESDAKDARGGQDKIYEWEAMADDK